MNYIFDFDGTIVDSFDYVLGFLAKEAGRPTPVGEEADEYRNLNMKDMALKLGIPFWKLVFLYFKGRNRMRAHMDDLQAFDGVREQIEELDEKGHRLFIISSNSGRNIRRFLIKNSMSIHFEAVWGGAGLLGKVNLIRTLRRRYKLKKDVTWYVGDEVRDTFSAKAAGIRSIAVSWGFASRAELEMLSPDLLLDKPEEISKSTSALDF